MSKNTAIVLLTFALLVSNLMWLKIFTTYRNEVRRLCRE